MDKHLHIVCFSVPYPVDYGGVFDLFYKIKLLYEQGIKLHLHCFEYGRHRQKNELDKYCEEIFYYKRKTGVRGFSLNLPYIVSSRKSDKLLANLLRDDYPVLLEGIHCSYHLYKNNLPTKKVFVRLHNAEFKYYKRLSQLEPSFFRKIYFLLESKLLKKYEKKIAAKTTLIAVNSTDIKIYEKEFKVHDARYLPVFLPFTFIASREGKGNYCLYHGNLNVAENEKAATWILKKIFNDLSVPLVIAGKNPSDKLRQLVQQATNCRLVANPVEEEVNELILNAQINILPSFNSTGIKIKLLNAIFNGRHCVVNPAAVAGTGLEKACCVSTDDKSFKENIIRLHDQEFTKENITLREKLLSEIYNNKKNAQQLIQWIW